MYMLLSDIILVIIFVLTYEANKFSYYSNQHAKRGDSKAYINKYLGSLLIIIFNKLIIFIIN